jgi:hypothetical protein
VIVLSFFFVFGATMSGLTFLMLLLSGSALDVLWRLNPRAHEGLSVMGWPALLLMGTVSLACITAAIGLWRCTRWGLWTALAILALNLLGDSANVLFTGDKRALIGLPIGGVMIWYLIENRRRFARQKSPG